jgi:hypothetical protein
MSKGFSFIQTADREGTSLRSGWLGSNTRPLAERSALTAALHALTYTRWSLARCYQEFARNEIRSILLSKAFKSSSKTSIPVNFDLHAA